MANCKVGNYIFDIDPDTATYKYSMKVNPEDTYGGRVIQILSCKIDSLVISGSIRPKKGGGQFEAMEKFADDIRSIMDWQAQNKTPLQFSYPALDWTGKVYLLGYKDVRYDVGTSVATYTLTFDIDSGFEGVKTVAVNNDLGFENIPDGVNWVRNEYNTPATSWEDVKTMLEGVLKDAGTSYKIQSLYDYADAVQSAEHAGGAAGLKADMAAASSTTGGNPQFNNMFGPVSSTSGQLTVSGFGSNRLPGGGVQ